MKRTVFSLLYIPIAICCAVLLACSSFSAPSVVFAASGDAGSPGASSDASGTLRGSGPDAAGASADREDQLPWPSGPSVNAESAIVMELSTGTILYEKNAREAQYPASITKIMTALLAVENCSMDEIVEFSETAVYGNGANSSSIGMNVGESLSMENCLYGLMLASANEVAKAIGEHISGSLDAFVQRMNERAQELGCVNTHFANSNGLHDDQHYTCAYDMALIAREAIRNQTFKKISGTRVYTIPPTETTDEVRWVANSHQMINPSKLPQYAYEDCYAGKTGFTDEARYTLVTFAKRGDLDLVCVNMHSQRQTDQFEDAITLLDYAFENFSTHTISNLDRAPSFDNFSLFTRFSPLFDMNNSPLSIDVNSYIILPNGASYADVTQSINYHEMDSIKQGSNVIGEISYLYGGNVVGYTDILYESSEMTLLIHPENGTGNGGQPADDSSSTGQKDMESEKSDSNGRADLKPWIIVAIFLALILIVALYIIFIELPHRRRRRAYYERRRRRRDPGGSSSYLDL